VDAHIVQLSPNEVLVRVPGGGLEIRFLSDVTVTHEAGAVACTFRIKKFPLSEDGYVCLLAVA
jgi:hypothetical protein